MMKFIDIPGFDNIMPEYLVLDFNGTLGIDGKIIDGVRQLLQQICDNLAILVLSADSFETVREQLSEIQGTLKIQEPEFQDIQTEEHVLELGKEKVVAIGNGLNDALMFKSAAPGIAVVQKEGAAGKTLLNTQFDLQYH
jgi:soluble P-type ATPase